MTWLARLLIWWFQPTRPDVAPDVAWLCECGQYQDDEWHCSACGREPPWGCDCGEHDELETDDGIGVL